MPQAEKGKFIVLEGQGFVGKSEQVPILVKNLINFGIPAFETGEPGGIEEALKIRSELLTRRQMKTISPEQELDLFYQARSYFIQKLIIPAKEMGQWPISSRFSKSTKVYQGMEGGVRLDLIQKYEDRVVGENQPDLTILIDVPVDVIIARMGSGGRERHSFNEMDSEKIKKRREYYLQIANSEISWQIVNGDQSIQKVSEDIWGIVRKII